eukprot:317894-Amphidinium_carterae.1
MPLLQIVEEIVNMPSEASRASWQLTTSSRDDQASTGHRLPKRSSEFQQSLTPQCHRLRRNCESATVIPREHAAIRQQFSIPMRRGPIKQKTSQRPGRKNPQPDKSGPTAGRSPASRKKDTSCSI